VENSEWRDVPGHPGYVVNARGEVGSRWIRVGVKGRAGTAAALGDEVRVLRPSVTRSGLRVHMLRGVMRCVHLMVLEAFAGPRPPRTRGRHRNGDRSDNRAENLAWGPGPAPARRLVA
jgi:hypothetical protein